MLKRVGEPYCSLTLTDEMWKELYDALKKVIKAVWASVPNINMDFTWKGRTQY